MKTYRVGGSVRDMLLGRSSHDNDYVVVGATPQDMLALGYTQVGADFPVFLHPETGDEYALARTERKVGQGHKGFETLYDPDVTLEEDLRRRDLTVNAMALDESTGEIFDPFGGQEALRCGVLAHVFAEGFVEDPLRVLRVARFAAQLGFKVQTDTMELMRQMAESGELDSLTPERVWKEIVKALESPEPSRFFIVLRDCGALEKVLPEVAALVGVPQPEQYHDDDAFMHTMHVLDAASRTNDPRLAWAALCHDLGKGQTPKEKWPHHYDHEKDGEPVTGWLCGRLKVPNDYTDVALVVTRYHMKAHRGDEMNAKAMVRLFYDIDAFRRPKRLHQLLAVCRADWANHKGAPDGYSAGDTILRAWEAVSQVTFQDLGLKDGTKATAIRDAFRAKRVSAVKQAGKASGAAS